MVEVLIISQVNHVSIVSRENGIDVRTIEEVQVVVLVVMIVGIKNIMATVMDMGMDMVIMVMVMVITNGDII